MSHIRKIKKASGVYLAEYETYRENGKVKQKFVKYIGKDFKGKPIRRVYTNEIEVKEVKSYLDIAVIDKLSRELNLNEYLGEKFKPLLILVYSHLLGERSINKIEQWVSQTTIPEILNLKDYSASQIYSLLGEFEQIDFTKIEDNILKVFENYVKDKQTIIIDITDTYFEGNSIKEKSRRGKDSKYKKLIQIGLGVSLKYGYPVLHKQYGGNISDINIFKDMIVEMLKKGYNSIIIDRGMYSKDNLESIEKLKIKSIVGVKRTQKIIKEYLIKLTREEIYKKSNRIKLKNTIVYIKSYEYFGGKLIIVYNPQLEYSRKEQHYEKGEGDEDVKFFGYSLIYHNTELDDSDAVRKYYEKDIVERSFKELKGVLSLRPIRVWLKEHIESHVKICYMAYAILSLFSYKIRNLEISPLSALEKLKTAYMITLEDKSFRYQWKKLITLEKIQQRIADAIGVVYKNQ